MAENKKTLNTRILLKYDTLDKWQTGPFNGADDTKWLKAGELAIVTLAPNKETNVTNKANQHPLLFKVGTGAHKFDDLPWASALAADVYDWAKKATLDANDLPEIPGAKFGLTVTVAGEGNAVTDANWDATTKTLTLTKGETFATKKELDDAILAINTTTGNLNDLNTTNKSNLVAAINEALQAVEVGGTGSVVTVIKDTTSSGSVATYTVKQGGNAVGDKIEIPEMVIASGDSNGSISVNGTDVAVTGLADAAYVTVKSLNDTAKGYADGVLGTSSDAATANTVYGAKAAAAAAQNDATDAKTKIDTFLGSITPDGSADLIDTLAEINKYVGDHGEEFAELSSKVTNIENGTTKIDADTVDGKHATDFIWYIASSDTINVVPVSGISSNPQISLNVEGTKSALGLSNYKTVQTAVADPTANGESLTFIDTISQNTNGEITATKKNVNLANYALKSELPTVNNGKFTVSGTGALTGSGEMTANQTGDTTATLDLTNEVKSQINGAVQEVTAGIGIKAVKTGTTVNLELVGKNETDDDGNTVTFIFDCGGAE